MANSSSLFSISSNISSFSFSKCSCSSLAFINFSLSISGVDVEAGKKPPHDGFMIIQGPLALNWGNRKWGIFPRIENGEIAGYGYSLPTPEIIDLWVRQHIHVKGEPNHIFIKVYTHGANELNDCVLLDQPMEKLFNYLESKYNDGRKYILHYVTAYEMFLKINEIEKYS